MDGSVVVASYRGPQASGSAGEKAAKAGGGLIQVLGPWAQEQGVLWVSAAEGVVTGGDGDGLHVGVAIDPSSRSGHYDFVSNSVLWPLFHGVGEWVAESIRDTEAAAKAWGDFRAVNQQFAERISEHAREEALVVVHDYQLLLVPGALRQMRPDLRVAYFHHIPFASASEFRLLPVAWRTEIVSSLTGSSCGFQSPRWESRYLDFCSGEGIHSSPATFVAPVCPSIRNLRRDASSSEVIRLRRALRERIGERKLIARVDRADPIKNVLGGIQALDALLSQDRSWQNEFVFAHHLVPTRASVDRYRDHLDEILDAVDTVNGRWGTAGWQPIHTNVADHREYGLALLAEYDVLLVNPVREGMNLVAYEGPSVNTRDGAMVLSEEAGAYDLLAPGVLGIDPTNPEETAAKLGQALAMPAPGRATRAEKLRFLIESLDSRSWHDEVVQAADINHVR